MGVRRARRSWAHAKSEGRTGEFLDNLEKSRPQQKLNSVKRYGCYYTAGRLLYTATVVAKG